MAKKNSLQLHQLISLFIFAVGINICIGFTANRLRRSGDGEDTLFSVLEYSKGYVENPECVDLQGLH
uniref:Uncharacterized protein n=1 Tax=Sphaerodactylus townsendi TaxID=933632 RepID=A0ACB8FE60_9SAUR